ncbi:MAG: flavodoxin domain-containing protein [Christensenellales bacterium]|jgi:menaquinone-dependent protoporphyrinogen oxidase
MKILIAYSTRSGTTAKCANLLAEKLPGATVVDLKRAIPNPNEYDAVIVGGALRTGSVTSETRQYLEICEPLLLKRPLGLYLCCGSEDQAEEVFQSDYAESILAHAKCRMSFGGELDPARAKGFEKMIIKMILKNADKNDLTNMRLYPERIDAFAKIMLDN